MMNTEPDRTLSSSPHYGCEHTGLPRSGAGAVETHRDMLESPRSEFRVQVHRRERGV